MLMSKSRLEKFLYALYSLDSSDLPNPLSKIEELYKCLVTGEEPPTFEPLSRVEKYLMAILGVYDANELPNPISRVEVLLYKLAIGDDNLEDVKSFLSEHEELLAEIIRNGGVGGDINIEYVLHTLSTEFNTLYNTAKKPVKSAILKGDTLVNLFDGEKMALNESLHYTYSNGIIKSTVDGQPWSSKTNMGSAIKPKTKYLLKVKNVGEYALNVQMRFVLSTLYLSQAVSVGQEVIKIIETGEEIDGLYIKIYPQKDGDGIYAQAKLNIIEYQDGIENWDIPYFEGMQSIKMPVLTTSNEDGTKTNILTVNEEVELRGIGDVQDTLDLITGEKVERIGEFVLNGNDETWDLAQDRVNTMRLNCYSLNIPIGVNGSLLKTDKFPYQSSTTGDQEGAVMGGGAVSPKVPSISILKTRLPSSDIDGFKQWLSQNPITVQYQLATESIKTVDLSVVDQDGNDAELSTFNDITHVTLSSEGLIPEAELEVATKNEEVLNAMSLEIDDIYATQNALQEISDTQSENVDATMLATTEIYEQLL